MWLVDYFLKIKSTEMYCLCFQKENQKTKLEKLKTNKCNTKTKKPDTHL